MATMTSLDTNIVLRFLLGDVKEQSDKAEKLIESTQTYVTDIVVVETIYVLEKTIGLPRSDITQLINAFLGFANVVHSPYFLLDTIALYADKPELSIVDCYAVMESKAYKNKLATFDKKLANQAGPHASLL